MEKPFPSSTPDRRPTAQAPQRLSRPCFASKGRSRISPQIRFADWRRNRPYGLSAASLDTLRTERQSAYQAETKQPLGSAGRTVSADEVYRRRQEDENPEPESGGESDGMDLEAVRAMGLLTKGFHCRSALLADDR